MKKPFDLSKKKKIISPSNRRDFIKKASIGGLGMGLLGTNVSAVIPAESVIQQSKATPKPKIKITDLKCAIMGGSPVVRIVTDAGISGYGQAESAKPYLKPMVLFYKDYLIGEDPTNVERCLMKIAAAATFVACFAFSMGPIKWVFMSEVFPTRISGRAVAISSLAVWIADAVLNQLFPILRDEWGKSTIFFVFAAILIPQFYFVWNIMPETKGKTLEEINKTWSNS